MGFFSWKCSKTNLSIPAYPYANLPREASEVVMVLPDDTTIMGVYDGYGNIGANDVYAIMADYITGVKDRNKIFEKRDDGRDLFKEAEKLIKIVRMDHYNMDTDRWDTLKVSKNCPDQGYFYEARTAKKIFLSTITTEKRQQ